MVLAAGVCASGAGAVADDARLCAELKVRDGLPNFSAKLKAQNQLKVAYLGGSITMADGWRNKTTDWLRQNHPGKEIVEIQSAIAGTGAGFGACRLQEHVLKEKPDLLFVEFRVNGGDRSMLQSMEGIVRQTWRLLPETDIVFVYTVSSRMLPDIRQGRSPGASAVELERVAAHYGIPSIDFGPEVVRQLDEGSLLFKGKSAPPGVVLFSTDGTHPTSAGHSIYLEIIARSFERILKDSQNAAPHGLKPPCDPANWERAGLVDPQPWLSGPENWETLPWDQSPVVAGFHKIWGNVECDRILPALNAATVPGSALEFSFTGTFFGFFDIGGPETGSVRITVDDEEAFAVPRFNAFCTRYRPQYYLSERLPDGKHTVRIELAGPALDKQAVVGAEAFGENPDYSKNAFYLVKLLVVGEMIDGQGDH